MLPKKTTKRRHKFRPVSNSSNKKRKVVSSTTAATAGVDSKSNEINDGSVPVDLEQDTTIEIIASNNVNNNVDDNHDDDNVENNKTENEANNDAVGKKAATISTTSLKPKKVIKRKRKAVTIKKPGASAISIGRSREEPQQQQEQQATETTATAALAEAEAAQSTAATTGVELANTVAGITHRIPLPPPKEGQKTLSAYCSTYRNPLKERKKGGRKKKSVRDTPTDTNNDDDNNDNDNNQAAAEEGQEEKEEEKEQEVQIIDGEIVIGGGGDHMNENGIPSRNNEDGVRIIDEDDNEQIGIIGAKYTSFLQGSKSREQSGASRLWTIKETEIFYEALRQVGTDFSIMEEYFPKNRRRTRRQLRNKYKKECAQNKHLVEMALRPNGQKKIDISVFNLTKDDVENAKKARLNGEQQDVKPTIPKTEPGDTKKKKKDKKNINAVPDESGEMNVIEETDHILPILERGQPVEDRPAEASWQDEFDLGGGSGGSNNTRKEDDIWGDTVNDEPNNDFFDEFQEQEAPKQQQQTTTTTKEPTKKKKKKFQVNRAKGKKSVKKKAKG